MKELINIQQELHAPKSQYNNFGKYHYRNCEDILEAVKPLLKKNNCYLTIQDAIEEIGGRVYVKATATLVNSDDKARSTTAYAQEAVSKKGMDSAQVTGATSSYARKYALNGLFLIDDTKDADTTTYERDIEQEIINCKSMAELKALHTSLAPATQTKYKQHFSNKKSELSQ